VNYTSGMLKLERWNPATDGAFSPQALQAKLEAMGYRVTTYVYPPGTYFGPHTHDLDKIDAVIQGRFRISMGVDSAVLQSGEWIFVPRGAEHSAEVVGLETVVSLDALRVR